MHCIINLGQSSQDNSLIGHRNCLIRIRLRHRAHQLVWKQHVSIICTNHRRNNNKSMAPIFTLQPLSEQLYREKLGVELIIHYRWLLQDGQQPGCTRHIAFLTVNLILIIVISILSILPPIQNKNPKSGLLQPALLGMYITYLTWSAITNDNCK